MEYDCCACRGICTHSGPHTLCSKHEPGAETKRKSEQEKINRERHLIRRMAGNISAGIIGELMGQPSVSYTEAILDCADISVKIAKEIIRMTEEEVK